MIYIYHIYILPFVHPYIHIHHSPLPPKFFSWEDIFHAISLEIPLIFVIVNHQVPPTDMFEKKGYNHVNVSGQKIVAMLRVAGFSEVTELN